MLNNTLTLGSLSFPITKAVFRYVPENDLGGPGWDFNIVAEPCQSLEPDHFLSDTGIRFYSEADPIPVPNLDDLTGVEIFLAEPFDPQSGEVYFTLYVFEHGDLINLTLRFLERDQSSRYRIFISATVPAGSVFDHDEQLEIHTWIEQLPTVILEQ